MPDLPLGVARDGADTGFALKPMSVGEFYRSLSRALDHPGGVPHVADEVMRESYSHEVSSGGFWPGGGAAPYAAFYSYAYPEPAGFRTATVKPDSAFYSSALNEYILPYDAVREAHSPDDLLLTFLAATYEAAASLGGWDRSLLERSSTT